MESQILTEFTLRLKQSVVDIYSQGELSPQSTSRQGKYKKLPPQYILSPQK